MRSTLVAKIRLLAGTGKGACEIAHQLGCHDAYVRKVAKRCGLQLPRSPYNKVPSKGAEYVRIRRSGLREVAP